MINEYSIACLVKEESLKVLKKSIIFLEKENYPHVSLFQFRTDEQLLITELQECIKNIEVSLHFTIQGIQAVENNIFLDILDDETLRTASDKLIEVYFKFCINKVPLSQIRIEELTANQAILVQKYGIYWVRENFRPHVTLAYNKTFVGEMESSGVIKLFSPQLYKIDSLGRINII